MNMTLNTPFLPFQIRDYWDHQNCVGWVREGNDSYDGCAVVMCNGDDDGCVGLLFQRGRYSRAKISFS